MLHIKDVHPMEEYMSLLETSTQIYIDRQRLVDVYDEVCHRVNDLTSLTSLYLLIESGGMHSSPDKTTIINYLLDSGVDMYKRYSNPKVKGLSLDMTRVVQRLINDGIAVDLLETYKELQTHRHYMSFFKGLMAKTTIDAVTSTGRHLVKYPTTVTERDNLRVYYSNIAVVSIPKIYSDIITVKGDDYYIAWCDYPQADWRFAYNLFIKDDQNYKVMQSCDDAYEGLVRMIEGDKFDPERFKANRKEYKEQCLSIFYNSKNNSPVASAIRKFFRSCPKYNRLLFDLNVLYKFKLPIPCTSYFGYTQNLHSEGTYPDAFISKGLNTPIQTFTSHVVNETVFGILERFWSLGYTKDDINVYFTRHDEPLFMFHKNVIKDAWIFKECSKIHIDGFTPINLEFSFGSHYQEEDEKLTRLIEQSIAESGHVFTEPEIGVGKDYYPLPSVESLHVQFFGSDGKYYLHFYDYRTSKRFNVEVPTKDIDEAIHHALLNGALKEMGNPRYMMICAQGLEFMDRVGDTLVKVRDYVDANVWVSPEEGLSYGQR